MRKYILTLMFLVSVAVGMLHAQQIKHYFVQMPDSINPLFTSVNRADFIDFLESKMKSEVSNSLGGKSEMTELTTDYLSIRTTPNSTWQMKLLPMNDSVRVICTISTVCVPACDSHFNFYTTDWKELASGDFLPQESLTMDSFMVSIPDTVDIYKYNNARRQADILLTKAVLNGKDNTLTFTLSTPDYMEKQAAEELRPFIRPTVTYVWKGGRFARP